MHQAEYVFQGDDRLTTHWQSMVDGELSDEQSITFELSAGSSSGQKPHPLSQPHRFPTNSYRCPADVYSVGSRIPLNRVTALSFGAHCAAGLGLQTSANS